MFKKLLFFILVAQLFITMANAQDATEAFNEEMPMDFSETASAAPAASETITAKVIEIMEQKDVARENGSVGKQQKIKLKGLDGSFKDKEFIHNGISEYDVLSANAYEKGDKVLVTYSKNIDGTDQFFISDYVRRWPLILLSILFVIVILATGKFKGFKSLIGLGISCLIIIKIIVPRILNGGSPLWIAIIGAFFIITIIIYLNEGWNKKSHISALSVLISLLITLLFSIIFTKLCHLTGLAQEEAMFLMGVKQGAINFQGLLLAGMLIGAVGVLDDIIVGQVEAVRQIKEANPKLTCPQAYKMGYKVGNTHLGAIINTLFLTYAGASLPLLLLFSVHQEPFITFSQVINHEVIATEIVRTLVGSMGVALAMPISTFLASIFINSKDSANIKPELNK